MFVDNVAIVIGNGESRAHINFKELKKNFTLIGCNAIHRDMNVDHIVCCDKRMVQEVLVHKKCKTPFIYTREKYFVDYNKLQGKKRVVTLPKLPYTGTQKQDLDEHWGSGPYAVLLSAVLNFKTVYIVGFDLYGKNNLVNNIYKNTNNYLKENALAIDPSFWIYQLRKVFLHYPDTKFKIFNRDNWAMPNDWQLPNVEILNIENISFELAKEINTLYT